MNGNNITNKNFNVVFTEMTVDELMTAGTLPIQQSLIISSADEHVYNETDATLVTYQRNTLLITDTNGTPTVLAYDANLIKDKLNELNALAYTLQTMIGEVPQSSNNYTFNSTGKGRVVSDDLARALVENNLATETLHPKQGSILNISTIQRTAVVKTKSSSATSSSATTSTSASDLSI